MNQKIFIVTASGLFSLIAVMHALRLVFGWEAVIGGLSVPRWVSGVAVVLFGYLGYIGATVQDRKPKTQD